MFDCIIFDLDGTLVDSETLCNRAYLTLIPALKLTEDQMVARFRGREFNTILREIETITGQLLPEGFETTYRAEVARSFRASLQAFPGVNEVLAQLDRPICIASSGPQAKIAAALEITGLSGFFGDRIYSAYDIQRWKPDPALFLHAAAAMGARAEACLVVEDSAVGVQAAQAAGMSIMLHGSHIDLPEGGVGFESYGDFLPGYQGLAQERAQELAQQTR